MSVSIAVVMTVHDRKAKTIECLQRLFDQVGKGFDIAVFLTDDGSTDGTTSAVKGLFPRVTVIPGDGTLFWAGGMRLAFGRAMHESFDYYLWINDDTFLVSEAISTLLSTAREVAENGCGEPIVIGTVSSSSAPVATHGGIRKWIRLNSTIVVPSAEIQFCETMFGNCVLIPHDVALAVGNIDEAFQHSIGDVDYGLRASKLGVKIAVARGFLGVCDLNPIAGSMNDPSLSLGRRYRLLAGTKGLPIFPFFTFLWRHLGFYGVAYGLWVYARVLLTWLRYRLLGF